MRVRKDFSTLTKKEDVFLTIGFFDGVHLGHQRIIREVVEMVKRSTKKGAQSCVVTFDRHPTQFFSGEPVKLLTSWEEKKNIFNLLGVDLIQVFTFNSQFASLSPDEFLQRLNHFFNIYHIAVGEEFRFGKQGEGDVRFLQQKQSQFGYTFKAISCLKLDGGKVSSSLLREWLQQGEIKKVTQGLGRYPTIRGKVIFGEGRGQEIGCPTANLQSDPQKLLPLQGVYAGCVALEGKRYQALINVGARPTFGDFTPGVEVHLIGVKRELYGQMLKVDLVERIRGIRSFSSRFHLSKQLEKDKRKAKEILSSPSFGRPLKIV